MSDSFDVVVAGHVCLDITPDFSQTPASKFRAMLQPGRLLAIGPVTIGGGGPVSNTGLGLRVLGVPTLLMGKVGDDLLGQILQQILAARSQGESGMIVDPASHTAYTIVISPPGMDRIFLHYPGANETFGADDVRYDLVGQARIFHFGYPPIMQRMYSDGGQQLIEVFRRAKATGVTTSLDMSLPDPESAPGRAPWREILSATLRCVDVFLPSGEEMLLMMRRERYEELHQAAGGGDILPLVDAELLADLSAELLALGPKIVGFKLGKSGFYLRTGSREALAGMGPAAPADPAAWADRELWAPAFQVSEVTATGSGDASIAGFLAGLLHGLGAETTLTAACAVGACNVEAADAISGLRSWEATLARAAAPWSRHPLTVATPGWRYDELAHLWRKA